MPYAGWMLNASNRTQTAEEGLWSRGLKEQFGLQVTGNEAKEAYSNDGKVVKAALNRLAF